MSITGQEDVEGLKHAGMVVSTILHEMKQAARVGMSTQELDFIGQKLFHKYDARSAPKLTYGFPGYTCISVNHQVAHGLPSQNLRLKAGDLVNIDVSAEVGGYFADTGHSFQLAPYSIEIQDLCRYTKKVLNRVVKSLKHGTPLNTVGRIIEKQARKGGYNIIQNLCSHGVGRALHEDPTEILPYYDKSDTRKLQAGTVITIEPFLSTFDSHVVECKDGWTLQTPNKSLVAQHEHTLIITRGRPLVVTSLPSV